MLTAAIIAAIAAIGGGIYGTVSANNRRKKALKEQDKKANKLDAWYNQEMNQNYVDRADSQAMLRRIYEYNTEAQRALDTNAIKRGATDEAKVAMAKNLNKNYASTVSQIAGLGSQHKDRVRQQYMNARMNLDDLKIRTLMDNSGTDNMINGITSAAGVLMQGFGASSGASAGAAAGATNAVNNVGQVANL